MYLYNIPNVVIGSAAIINNIENINFSKDIVIDNFVFIEVGKKLTIGSHTHISMFSLITGNEEINIGEFCTISPHCNIMCGSDDFKSWGMGNLTTHEKYRTIIRKPVIIERLCRIGTGTVVMPGVYIREGVSVGANSVVTKNLDEPFGIYIGNKLIGRRPKDKIMQLYEQFLKEQKEKEKLQCVE